MDIWIKINLIEIFETSKLLETTFNTKITKIENKTSDTSDLVTNTQLKANVTQLETRITKVTDLVTTAAFNIKATKVKNKYLILVI